MEKETKRGIVMISAATLALKTKREGSGDAMNEVARLAKNEKDSQTKIAMVAAASKALEIAERNPEFSDRQVINQLVGELPGIISTVKEHNG